MAASEAFEKGMMIRTSSLYKLDRGASAYEMLHNFRCAIGNPISTYRSLVKTVAVAMVLT